jgi:hypothetical protein
MESFRLKNLKKHLYLLIRASNGSTDPVFQWIESLPSKQNVAGSIPARVAYCYSEAI